MTNQNWDNFAQPGGAMPGPFDPSQGSLFEQTLGDTQASFQQAGIPVPDVPTGPFDPSQGSLFDQTLADTQASFEQAGIPVPDVPTGPFDPSQGSLFDQTRVDANDAMDGMGRASDFDGEGFGRVDAGSDAGSGVGSGADGVPDDFGAYGVPVDMVDDEAAHEAAWAEMTTPTDVNMNVHITVEVIDGDVDSGAVVDDLDDVEDDDDDDNSDDSTNTDETDDEDVDDSYDDFDDVDE